MINVKRISLVALLLLPLLAQASAGSSSSFELMDRNSKEYRERLAYEKEELKKDYAPIAKEKESLKKQYAPKSKFLEFYKNNKVLIGATLGIGSGLAQAYIYSQKTPYEPSYAASAWGGALIGAAAGALNVVPEVLVCGNVGTVVGYNYNLRPEPQIGFMPGVIAGTALGLAYNHGKDVPGGLMGGAAIGAVLSAQSGCSNSDVVFFSCLGGLAGSAAAVVATKLRAENLKETLLAKKAVKLSTNSEAYESALASAPCMKTK